MANITVRNIPDSVFEKIKLLSEVDRRSLNNEILIALEKGMQELEKQFPLLRHKISVETQIELWKELSGSWKDSKSKEQTIKEIYDTRSYGRDVSL
jgi:plasmid stability protein